jgi:hypothetical protein
VKEMVMPKKRMNEDVERAILNMKGQAGVERELAARGGMSRADLMSDRDREASSPLGHGSGSKKPPPKKHGKEKK